MRMKEFFFFFLSFKNSLKNNRNTTAFNIIFNVISRTLSTIDISVDTSPNHEYLVSSNISFKSGDFPQAILDVTKKYL